MRYHVRKPCDPSQSGAAKADFMEHSKGSLEAGKDADFVILDQDIMQVAIKLVPEIKVLQTFIGGEVVLER